MLERERDPPVVPVFMSTQWCGLFKRAVGETARLGIEMGVNLCSGRDASVQKT